MTSLGSLLKRKVRGVRVVDLLGAACLVLIVFVVYASKIRAGAEAARIADTTRQIAAEEQQVQLLRVERAYLTQPERLRRLSSQYLNMGPIPASHETTPDALLQQQRQVSPAPAAPAPAAPAPEAPR